MHALVHFFMLLIWPLVAISANAEQIRIAPGDDKTGYETTDYVTDSLSLERRTGNPTNLQQVATEDQLGLPPLSSYQQHKPDAAQIELGRKLFFDRRLSRNKTMSCAMCHVPEQGFTSNELKRPVGFEGRLVKRNAPTVLNVRFYEALFVDARESTLAQQVWAPLLADNEVNNPSIGSVVAQINADPEYRVMFDDAFGQAADMLNIGIALAQYQQSLVAGDSAFDRFFYGKDSAALSDSAKQGLELFRGKATCAVCHTIGPAYALFTDQKLHSTGAGYQASMARTRDPIPVQLAPGVSTTLDPAVVNSVGEQKPNDLGRYEVTLDPDDRWLFRTPSLRNIAVTAPYMHNGEFLTLRSVLDFYNQGGVQHEQLSPLIRPLNLSEDELSALESFLNSLTSSKLQTLVADAFAAEVGDENANREP